MSIAPINSEVLSLTEEKSMLEADVMRIDIEIQHLAIHSGQMYTEYSELLEKEAIANNVEAEADNDTVDEFNWDEFKREYEVAQAKVENQNKMLEIEKDNKKTKLTAVTTLLESAKKRLDKNTESELKGFS